MRFRQHHASYCKRASTPVNTQGALTLGAISIHFCTLLVDTIKTDKLSVIVSTIIHEKIMQFRQCHASYCKRASTPL